MDFGLSDIWWVLGKHQATRKFVLAAGKTVSPHLSSSHRVSLVSQTTVAAAAP